MPILRSLSFYFIIFDYIRQSLTQSYYPSFKEVSPHFMHREQISYDSQANIKSLSNILYVSLDTFHKVSQNIDTKLQAWLTFLSSAEPADILKLVSAYPEFKEYYKDIVEFRIKPKELISMYSEALAILDHNTELYMISELQNTVKELKDTVALTEADLAEKTAILSEVNAALSEKDAALSVKDSTIAALQKELEELRSQVQNSK